MLTPTQIIATTDLQHLTPGETARFRVQMIDERTRLAFDLSTCVDAALAFLLQDGTTPDAANLGVGIEVADAPAGVLAFDFLSSSLLAWGDRTGKLTVTTSGGGSRVTEVALGPIEIAPIQF